ncbi:hypothetical protein AAVH_07344 [Aphelenchoides avenae]|nr:hypothetical protein AAVH_07344 [Aphelenchus avenae]
MIEAACDVVTAFRGFIVKLQQQHVPTISLLLPGVEGLVELLEHFKIEDKIPEVCDSLINGLKRRFSDVLESGSAGKDPIYLASSCLDPVVQKEHNYFEKDFNKSASCIRAMAQALELEVDKEVEEVHDVPATSHRSTFGFDVPNKRVRVSTGSQRDRLKTEIIEYRSLIASEEVTKTFEFWTQHQQQFSLLSTIAFNILIVPGASSAVEQFFSQV